jgi:zinc metalloprotease ZmpB
MPWPRRTFRHLLPLLPALLLALAWAPASLAKRAPARDPEALALVSRAPDLRAIHVVRGRVVDGLQRGLDRESGLLRRFWLREPGAAPRTRLAPRDAALGFLADHATELGLAADRLDRDLAPAAEKASLSGTHFRWNQQVGGVPVYRAEIVVKVSPLGQVSSVQNNLVADLAVPTTVPAIARESAVATGAATIAPSGRPLGPYGTELTVVPLAGGAARLAWLVSVPNEKPMGDWQVFVDAGTGEVFGVVDRLLYAEGTGRVFDPDPLAKTGDSTLVDNDDADSAVPFPGAYDVRALRDLTLSGGVYSLSGPYASLIDNESPTTAPVTATHPDSFRFQRSASGFEDVNCYFHLDASERYLQDLGFTNVNNRVQEVDSHGLSGADNSHYVPSTGRLAFGEGGVDDAEDADVIWHEYGHSIQDDIVPGWGGDQEGAMGEGFGDYWAGSYSLSLYPSFQPNSVFNWDGHNAYWDGRLLIDTSFHYPEDCCGEVHDSGTLWCSGLMDCWWRLGREVMDRLVIDHHFALGTSATMADAAAQLIQSDIDLYGGAHVATLVERLGAWGFVDPADYVPIFTHTPLADRTDVTGPYAVTANVTSITPLDAGSPRLLWGVGSAITDSVTMTPTGTTNQYAASIPGPGAPADIRYYLRAVDTNGGAATHPAGAPATVHVFHVGPDETAPTIAHTALGDVPLPSWPATVSATVTDASGVAAVTVAWTLNGAAQSDLALARVGPSSVFAATFPTTPTVAAGDLVGYAITATDSTAAPNVARDPASGEHIFHLIDVAGTVLVLDDDEVAAQPDVKLVEDPDAKGSLVALRAPRPYAAASASDLASVLADLGYAVTVQSATSSTPATWPSYSFIVSASGSNTAPVASSTYRSALESYVAAGHKLLIEGGELGYDAASYPGYPTFAANVLHVTGWATDNAGNLTQVAAQAAHPLATVPNALPATLPISYASYGNEDALVPASGAVVVYQTASKPGDAGILAYDDDAAPEAGQIVLLAFDFKKLGDATLRSQLVANAAHYLLARETQPTASIAGHVSLGRNPQGPSTTLTLSPTGRTTTTDSTGDYRFDGLYALGYVVTAARPGYQPATRSVTVAEDEALTGVDLHLYPQLSAAACRQPALSIPDNTAIGVQDTLEVADVFSVQGVTLSLNLTHTYVGDLVVELRHGAKTVRLRNHTGGSSDNIVGTFPTTLTVDGPGTLADFVGEASAGKWILFCSDNASYDTGVVNQWCLTLAGPVDTTAVVAVEPGEAPQLLALSSVVPNPSRGGGAVARFALPRAGAVSLALYDVGGRRVRTLVDGALPEGLHACRWDGRDDAGRALAPGIYLMRLEAGGRHAGRRVAVLR